VQREIRIRAPPQTVFAFLTDPAKMVRWMGTQATFDPRPGGTYRLTITGRDRDERLHTLKDEAEAEDRRRGGDRHRRS
jgi:uncharacterized protein YndB with AHSA1/START domain